MTFQLSGDRFPELRISAPLRLLARLGWMAALATVVALSLHPKYGPPGAFQLDKIAHTVGYGVLAGMPFVAFAARRAAIWTAIAMLPLGLCLEALQAVVPGRYTDPVDAVFSTLGVVLGLALGVPLRRGANRLFAAHAG